MSNSLIALIPARSGSKRVKSKNIKLLNGHPLLAYTIASAAASKIFDRIIVSTDNDEIADIARKYGADVPFLRPAEYAGDLSPDFEWISYTIDKLPQNNENYDYFAILRPTSPFRLPETIIRAWSLFSGSVAASLRAVEKCGQHPYKMWLIDNTDEASVCMKPLMPEKVGSQWGYNTPYQALPEIYVQNASLEISKTSVLKDFGSITGESIIPFFTEGYEGFDINTPYDWELAEKLIASGAAVLPKMPCKH